MRRWNNGRSQNSLAVPLGALKPWMTAILLSLVIHSGLFAVIAVRSYVRRQTEAVPLPIGTGTSRVQFFDTSGDDGGGGDGNRAADRPEPKAPMEQVTPPPAALSALPQPASDAVAISEPPLPANDTPTDAPSIDLTANREVRASVDVPSSESVGGTSSGVGIGDGSGSTEAGGGTGGSGTVAGYARNPLPPYPREAREHGWQGTTLLRVEVLSDGTVGKVEVAESSGHAILDESSVQTVRDWMFRPARSGITAIPSVVEIPITFRLAQ